MSRSTLLRTLCPLLFAVLFSACDDDDPALGEAGESCTRRADCAEGLACLAGVCRSGTAGGGDAGSDPLPAGEGGACDSRSDCLTGLACMGNRCMPASVGVDPDGRYGTRGESCQAKNDCDPSLACVSNMCREVTLSLSHTGKDCYRVECAETADCCADFVPNENCPTYEENCAVDPIFCNTYRTLCECSRDCVDEVCVAAAQGCAMDAECTSMQTPFCVESRCSQCAEDSDCLGAGTQCVAGVCMAACAIDENCPLLHACQDSVCVDVGCTTDRECVFVTGDPQARCVEGECGVPCSDDADCAADVDSRFSVCENERCVFVGCESDAECRALLDLHSTTGDARAVCR